jgi:hypothetical protein
MQTRTVIHVLIAAVGITACVVAWMVTAGCQGNTPVAGSIVAWGEKYEPAWEAVISCWNYEPAHPVIMERNDCFVSSEGVMVYKANYSPTGYAAGEFQRPNIVWLCPDARAARHEFSHYVRAKLTGYSGANYSGECWL